MTNGSKYRHLHFQSNSINEQVAYTNTLKVASLLNMVSIIVCIKIVRKISTISFPKCFVSAV